MAPSLLLIVGFDVSYVSAVAGVAASTLHAAIYSLCTQLPGSEIETLSHNMFLHQQTRIIRMSVNLYSARWFRIHEQPADFAHILHRVVVLPPESV
eukprot:4209503-Amphidinium_carterae.1